VSPTSSADLIITGRVLTADPDRPWAEAVAVRDGAIHAVGSRDDVRGTVDDSHADVLDATDGLVLPGFVDAHAHVVQTGASLTRAALRDVTDLDALQQRVVQWARANPAAPRVLGSGWNFSAIPGGRPTRQMLDAVSPDRPVYLTANDFHSVWCNSAALAELGVTDATPDPIGGSIVRDAGGAATGLLLEAAAHGLAWPVMERASDDDRDRHLHAAIDTYLASGTTSAVDMLVREDTLATFTRADSAGQLPFTVIGHWHVDRTGDTATELAQVARAAEQAVAHPSGRVRMAGIKIIADGTIDGCTAGMCEPYTNGEPGDLIWPRDALEPVVLAADAVGLQIAIHAIGDLAIRTAIDCLEIAARERAGRGDTRPRRHRIEHLEYCDPKDIARLAPLGITASMQPVHVDPAYLDNWIELLGDTRAQLGFAWPLFLAHGTHLAFGTDTPTAAHHPLPNMYIAATRRSPYVRDAQPLRADFALPLVQAIGHATADAAWSCFEEGRRGMLRPGLAADLVVLDRDPTRLPLDELLETQVVHTFVAGRDVHPH
jgi:predicted amidohydrolase YtcJ